MCECGTKVPFAALLQCYIWCIICNDSQICRKNLLTEMQHGGESSSMPPATASLNLAMRRARQTGSRIATADLPEIQEQGRDFRRPSGGPFRNTVSGRGTRSRKAGKQTGKAYVSLRSSTA